MWTNETRRSFLRDSALGLGWLAAADLFTQSGAAAPSNPFAPKAPPLPATAKSVIHLFMQGGPSHVDTFDPKPLLRELDGKNPAAELWRRGFSKRQIQVSDPDGFEVGIRPTRPVRVGDLRALSACRTARR